MRPRLASLSLLLFGVSIVFWLLFTAFESALVGTSPGVERVLIFVFLVLPATIGIVLGIISWRRKESNIWLAIAGILLNLMFALFNMMILLFAG